jgi:uncharacterized protein YndB with AHSA1/START domain
MSQQQISSSITVDAPPATIFAILSDPAQHARIDGSGSVGSVIEAPARLRDKGDTFTVHMKLFGVPYKITNKVVELEEDRRLAWRHFGAHRWRYELSPTDDGGTTVTETFDYTRYGPLWKRLLHLTGFPARNRQGIEQTLVRLREAAEADAAQGAA